MLMLRWGAKAVSWRHTVCSFGLGRRARAAIKSRLPSPIPSLRMNLNFHQTTKRRRRLNQTSGFHSSLHPLRIARSSLHYSFSLLRHPFSRKREKRWAGCAGMPFGDSLTMELKVQEKQTSAYRVTKQGLKGLRQKMVHSSPLVWSTDIRFFGM